MNSQELGRRLKEARLAKKMTQSQVVGDFITRNMLSQIESGTATPSIKTLEYLSGVLDISMAMLIPDSDRSSGDAERIIKAKKAIEEKQYDEAISALENDSELFCDEVYALRSIAYYEAAQQASLSGELQKAVDYAKKSLEYSGLGIYRSGERADSASALMNRSAKQLSDYYAALITE